MRIGLKCLCLLLVFLLLFPAISSAEAQVFSAPLSRASSARNGMVRVFLSSLGNPSSLNITVQGSYTIGGNTADPLSSGERIKVNFSSASGKLTMTRNGTTKDMGSTFTLTRHSTSSGSGLLIAESKNPSNPYPGDLKFTVQKSGSSYKLYTVASIYIETYLYGVLPYEMGNSAHIEALKAQAVAARTYTLDKMNRRASGLYDVVDTTNDQVYRGTPTGNANCKAAVDATKGIVVMNGSSLTSTYYTASNGGQTESAANAWGSSSAYSYLQVKDDPFDLQASGAQKRSLTVYGDFTNSSQKASLKSLLVTKANARLASLGYQTAGASIRTITNIIPHTPKYASPSRLYTKLDFILSVQAKNSRGVWQNISITVTCDIFSELESILGMSINSGKNEIWSVSKSGSNFVIVSRRYGHGVGLSQQGAMQMGRLGYTYDQILGFYYTGCKRMQHSFTHTIMSPVSDGASTIITTTENPADLGAEDADCTAIVSLVNQSDLLGIRTTASTSGQLIGAVPNGAPVKVYAVTGDWCFISYGQLKGYAQLSGLIFSGDAPTETDEKPTQVSQFATVTASGYLNLRAQAKTSSDVLGTAPTGAVLSVFSVSNGWAHVQYGAITAYASSDYLRFSSTYPSQVANPGQTQAVVTLEDPTETVNFRESASTSSSRIGRLPHGTIVTLIKNDGAWCRVSYQGQTGYIMSDYLTLTDAVGEETPQPTAKPDPSTGVQMQMIEESALFSEASSETQELTRLAVGALVVKLGEQEAWARISYNEQVGYVPLRTLGEVNDSQTGSQSSEFATVTTQSGSLNLRSRPQAGSVILTTIPRNTRIKVLSRGDWCQVYYNGETGYVMSSFLTFERDETASDDLPSTSLTALVTTQSGSLNLRELPQSWAGVLEQIPQYTRLDIFENDGYWSKTRYNGYTGYVMTKYLTFENEGQNDANTNSSAVIRAYVDTASGSLNLRSSPRVDAAIKRTIPRHAWVTVLEHSAPWCKVDYEGTQGYAMTQYLAIQFAETATATPAPATQTPVPDPEAEMSPSEATPTPLPTPAATPEPEFLDESARVHTANGKALNLRMAPNGDIITGIPNNKKVIVLKPQGEWTLIAYEDAVGYVMSSFLVYDSKEKDTAPTARPAATPAANEPAPIPPTTPPTVVPTSSPQQPIYDPTLQELEEYVPAAIIAGTTLNLRAYCSVEAEVLMEMPADGYVLVLAEGENWCRVSYEGEEGYCMTQYLQIIPY